MYLMLFGASNVDNLKKFQDTENVKIVGLRGANLLKPNNCVSELLNNTIPYGDVHLNLWLGNEIDSLAAAKNHSDILVGHDALANRLVDGFVWQYRYRQSDPLQILKLYTGDLLKVANDAYEKYVVAIKELLDRIPKETRVARISVVLMGPRVKKDRYHHLLINLMIYYVNCQLRKKMASGDLSAMWKTPSIGIVDIFMQFFTGGQWGILTRNLMSENEVTLQKWYGSVHYTDTIYRDLYNMILW